MLTTKQLGSRSDFIIPLKSHFSIALFLFVLHLLYNYIYVRLAQDSGLSVAFQNDYMGNFYSLCLAVPYVGVASIFFYFQLRRSGLADLFVGLLIVLYFLPGITLYIYGNWTGLYLLFFLLSSLMICIVNESFHYGITSKMRGVVGAHPMRQSLALWVVSLLVSFATIAIVTYYKGFSVKTDLSNIYAIRSATADLSIPTVFNYFIAFAARLTPILILVNAAKRNVLPCFFLGLSQLVSFSFNAMKFSLFSLLLTIPFILLSKKITNVLMFKCWFLLCIIAVIELCFVGCPQEAFIAKYIIRRVSFGPAQLGFFYFDFFQNEDYLYYSGSFLRRISDYPYERPLPYVIGDYAFGNSRIAANTGMVSEGFAQIGWWSLLVYPVIYVMLFKLVELAFRGFDAGSGCVSRFTVILYMYTFIDTSIPIVLFTFGLLPLLLVVSLLGRYNSGGRRRIERGG